MIEERAHALRQSAITLFPTEAPRAVILSERAERARAKDLLVRDPSRLRRSTSRSFAPAALNKQILRACGAQDDSLASLCSKGGETTLRCKIARGPAEK